MTYRERRMEEEETKKEIKLEDIHNMMQIMMKKLDKLELIEENIKTVEQDLKDVKDSIEFAHAEIHDLKKDSEARKKTDDETRRQIEKLEKDNANLNNSIIDLKARSMRNNLIFYNIEEHERENTTEIIHKLLEEKMDIQDAATKIKIDRSLRLGRRRESTDKPRPIVVKFNYHEDKEHIRFNAKKLKGTRIGISEQYPEEIAKIRQSLIPELKKAKAAGKKVKLVRDKLIIDGHVFKST